MSSNLMDDMVMDLDLNQEPMDPSSAGSSSLGLGSLLSDLETAHNRIEERIRQLEAVTARALQRHRWRQSPTTFDAVVNLDTEMQGQTDTMSNSSMVGRSVERGKGCKRDSSHLVAKALEMDLAVNNKVDDDVDDGGSFFDCNICLDVAKEPILTCCGHLYCWPCFYQLPYVDSTTKECPVCKGEVADGNVTPIYGNGDGESITELESGLKIPPRPKARRVESVRQQRVTQGLSHIPVAEALRRIRTSIGLGNHPQQQENSGVNLSFGSNSNVLLQTADTLSSRRLRSRLFSRVLSEGAASLSSELDNAQRMFEDLAASLTDRLLQRSNVDVVPAVHGATDGSDSFRRDAAFIQSNYRTLDAVAGTGSTASVPSSSSQANEVSDAALQLENLTTDTGNLTAIQSSVASRRRRLLSRLSDIDLRETRRRRLN